MYASSIPPGRREGKKPALAPSEKDKPGGGCSPLPSTPPGGVVDRVKSLSDAALTVAQALSPSTPASHRAISPPNTPGSTGSRRRTGRREGSPIRSRNIHPMPEPSMPEPSMPENSPSLSPPRTPSVRESSITSASKIASVSFERARVVRNIHAGLLPTRQAGDGTNLATLPRGGSPNGRGPSPSSSPTYSPTYSPVTRKSSPLPNSSLPRSARGESSRRGIPRGEAVCQVWDAHALRRICVDLEVRYGVRVQGVV